MNAPVQQGLQHFLPKCLILSRSLLASLSSSSSKAEEPRWRRRGPLAPGQGTCALRWSGVGYCAQRGMKTVDLHIQDSTKGVRLRPVTRRSRLEKRRDETRRDETVSISSRDFVSRDHLGIFFCLNRKKRPRNSKSKFGQKLGQNFASYLLGLVSRLVS